MAAYRDLRAPNPDYISLTNTAVRKAPLPTCGGHKASEKRYLQYFRDQPTQDTRAQLTVSEEGLLPKPSLAVKGHTGRQPSRLLRAVLRYHPSRGSSGRRLIPSQVEKRVMRRVEETSSQPRREARGEGSQCR